MTNLLESNKATIDNLHMDKLKGIIDEDMYKKIYDKTKLEIDKLNIEKVEIDKNEKVYV